MPKSWFSVKAAQGDTPPEVAIRGYIGDWGVTDEQFISDVQALGDVPEMTLAINSRGGDVDQALSMFNFLQILCKKTKVTCRIDGVAMSAASIVALAADKIVMPANALMMIHNPWTCAAGDANALRQTADNLQKYQDALVQTYVARTGKPEAEIQQMLDEETYLSAQEAKDKGFCDEVLPVEARGASVKAFALALSIPEEVLARVERSVQAAAPLPAPAPSPAPAPAAITPPPAAVTPPATPQPTLAAAIQGMAKAAGLEAHASLFILRPDLDTPEKAQAAVAQAREIKELCEAVAMPDHLPSLLSEGKTLAQAREALINFRATAADGQKIDGHPPAVTPNPKAAGSGAPVEKMGDVYARNAEAARQAFPWMFQH